MITKFWRWRILNLSTIALALLAWQLLSNNNGKQNNKSASPLSNISQFVSDDTKSILDCVEKLSDKNSSQEDKTGALFQMMTNPTFMNMASGLFKKTEEKQEEPVVVNDEGYKFETPSKDSREFFKPIDNIADAEVKHKLYWFYDNWYVK